MTASLEFVWWIPGQPVAGGGPGLSWGPVSTPPRSEDHLIVVRIRAGTPYEDATCDLRALLDLRMKSRTADDLSLGAVSNEKCQGNRRAADDSLEALWRQVAAMKGTV